MGDFARHIRGLYYRRRHPPATRGVIGCPESASEPQRTLLRAIGNELFERVVLVDDMFLVAFAACSEAIRLHSVIVDVGYSSIRAGLVHGTAPSPDERIASEFGCGRLVDTFQDVLNLRYPELPLTNHTVERLKTDLAFVSPAQNTSTLRVRYEGEERAIDVTELVHEATATLLPELLETIRETLVLCPSDEIAPFQRNILLVGGGASIPGLATRVERELHADGFEFARVVVVPNAQSVVARGAR